ncbi:MAG: hypothetical protein HXX18_14485 [Bacteroidetes bacterium]|nr:hypothetical protein [Bacteroidota bacterium]
MKFENPISTVRKAIKGTADVEAEKSNLDKPQNEHYEEVFAYYRFLKMTDPEMYEKAVISTAKGVDLKNEMGNDLYKLFTNVLEEITTKNSTVIENSLESLKQSNQFTKEGLNQKILELNKELIKTNNQELRDDLRLISAFSGKEELLEKTIDYISSGMLESIENES